MPVIQLRDLSGMLLTQLQADSIAQALEILALQGTSLPRADFRGINLAGATLRGLQAPACDCSGATLDRAKFQNAHCPNANFTGASLAFMQAHAARFAGARFDQMDPRSIGGFHTMDPTLLSFQHPLPLPLTDPRHVDFPH